MSVINQMLKDLDARGGGDTRRRAALASVGQGVTTHRDASRWVLVALLVAAALAMVAAMAWWYSRPAAVSTDVPLEAPSHEAGAGSPVAPAAMQALDNTSATPVPEPGPKPARPSPRAASPVTASTSSEAPERSTAVPSPPPPRTRIEIIDAPVDPLASVRERVAAGDAEAALALLSEAQASAAVPLAEADALAAAALQQLGRHDEAIERYARAIQRSPDIGAWWAGLGISLEAQGRAAEALAAYRDAQRRGPLDPALADYLRDRVDALSAGNTPR